MSGRDLLRNPLTGFSMLFMFGIVLTIYMAMWAAFTALGPNPTVTIHADDSSRAARVAHEMAGEGVEVLRPGSNSPQALITVRGTSAEVLIAEPSTVSWNAVWLGLRSAGFAGEQITIVDTEGDVKVDPLRINLGIVAMTGITSVAFIGTTVPLVAMRQRGLLRLFGTTPLRRSTFLLAQLPARVFVGLIVIAITLAIAVWRRYVDGIDVLSLGATLLLGMVMFFAIGMLFAARSRNAEATQQGMAMLTIMLAFASGGLLPPWIVPGIVQAAMNCLPTTWLAVAASADLTGATPFAPLPVLWALMAASTVCAATVAARLFEWDQSEPREKPFRHRREKVTA